MNDTDTDHLVAVRQLAGSVFAEAAVSDDPGLDSGLWEICERVGLARLTLPEVAGGSAGTLIDAAEVLMIAGARAARIPLVETDLLAGWLLHTVGIAVPSGPLTGGVADLRIEPDRTGLRISGTVRRVPWARDSNGIVVLSGDHVVLLDPSQVSLAHGANLAGEPRDDVTALDAHLRPERTASAPRGAAGQICLRAALGRALLLAGAASAALAQSSHYASGRIQFGRPIAQFQAVQQQLALAAAETAAATSASRNAALTAQVHGFEAPESALAVAVAKARASEAAGLVASVAHQVHGAIGLTLEHPLRLVTTRLWAWRDEDGSEADWQGVLGDSVVEAGAEGLWSLITDQP